MPNFLIALVALSVGLLPVGGAIAMEEAFTIKLTGKKVSFDTATGITTINGEARRGLVAASTRRGQTMLRYWQSGAFRETITLNETVLVDGLDVTDTARVSGFRLARDGSYAYLRSTKGPKARVLLIQDGQIVRDWPRGHHLRIIAFDRKHLILSETMQKDHATAFFRFERAETGRLQADPIMLGSVKGCEVQSARMAGDRLLLQIYCSHEKGSDIVAFDMTSGTITPILATEKDEMFGSSLLRTKDHIPILQVDGNENGRRAFYAISNIFLASLGEPMSLASDEAGTQSWGQSFRLRTLGALAQKTGHPIFAVLARYSIGETLAQQNAMRNLVGENNPTCGWASRIYSQDGKSPISLLVNQAMIASSMLTACERMGVACSEELQEEIMDNARCLVRAYEPNFETESALYRIPYASPFRFDGIWAPWNWQLAWAPVLEAVGIADSRSELVERAHGIASRFTATWQLAEQGALWRYWTPAFYQGWVENDRISKTRPTQKVHAPRRFEDTAHAGISLLGLQSLKLKLPHDHRARLQSTLDHILSHGIAVPRDLDGVGPRSARWLPGSGFDAYATDKMRSIFSRNIPGARAGDQLLAMANLIDPDQPIRVKLTLQVCKNGGCQPVQAWPLRSLAEIVEQNPLFQIIKH